MISRRIGKYHKDEHDSKRLCEWHFPSHIPKGEGRKREKPSRCCFVCSKIPGEILKGKRTSYWCEDCGKALCVVPCFKIYHTQTDYKLHAKILGKGYLRWRVRKMMMIRNSTCNNTLKAYPLHV